MKWICIILLAFSALSCSEEALVVDNYHGTLIKDCFRWLEDLSSEKTKNWIALQRVRTENFLEKIPARKNLHRRLSYLWNYEKISVPKKIGDFYVFSKNNGLQEQSVIYIQSALDQKKEVLFDPNTLSKDGSLQLTDMSFSKKGDYCSFSLSRHGSDWKELHVMDVKTKTVLDDHLKDVKFSSMAWEKDGFYYCRYDQETSDTLKDKNAYQKLYYHKIGTPQSTDKLIFENPLDKEELFSAHVTEDEKFLIVYARKGCTVNNKLYFKNLEKEEEQLVPLFAEPNAEYHFIDHLEKGFLIRTNKNASRYKLVLVDPTNSSEKHWTDVISETYDPLTFVSHLGGKLFAGYLKDAQTVIKIYDTKGKFCQKLPLPEIGTVLGVCGKRDEQEVFYAFTSFTKPLTIYRYLVDSNRFEIFYQPNIACDLSSLETEQVFARSSDGTKIPLFITHKKGVPRDGKALTVLTAYGGFNCCQVPVFTTWSLPLLEDGAVFAVACLRGGGEYGEEWHRAGMLENKQNVFDDFIACANFLKDQGYTSKEKLAIMGASNGGLLIGAVVNQCPDLAKVAIPQVGVMDMLRFHQFTIGAAWIPEYGTSDDKDQFAYLYRYSPLHNIKREVQYPAMLITTADHDDRVFPAHSFKYVAELQKHHQNSSPILIRIANSEGHGRGRTRSKAISLWADLLTFIYSQTGSILDFPSKEGSKTLGTSMEPKIR